MDAIKEIESKYKFVIYFERHNKYFVYFIFILYFITSGTCFTLKFPTNVEIKKIFNLKKSIFIFHNCIRNPK